MYPKIRYTTKVPFLMNRKMKGELTSLKHFRLIENVKSLDFHNKIVDGWKIYATYRESTFAGNVSCFYVVSQKDCLAPNEYEIYKQFCKAVVDKLNDVSIFNRLRSPKDDLDIQIPGKFDYYEDLNTCNVYITFNGDYVLCLSNEILMLFYDMSNNGSIRKDLVSKYYMFKGKSLDDHKALLDIAKYFVNKLNKENIYD